MLFTLASVPLALHYLSTTEFGLWALTTQVVGYVALVDLGLSVSASRILIDYKDRRASGEYGSVVQTGALVGLSQGLLVFVVGAVVSWFVGSWLRVPPKLEPQFVWLMAGHCALTGVMFAARIFSHLLTAHQRYDITNYAQAILFAANYGVLWLGFARGAGVFSVLWGQALGTVAAVGFNIWGCARLKLFPHPGEWWLVAWDLASGIFGSFFVTDWMNLYGSKCSSAHPVGPDPHWRVSVLRAPEAA